MSFRSAEWIEAPRDVPKQASGRCRAVSGCCRSLAIRAAAAMLAESAVAGASQASSTVMFVLVYTQISPAIVRLCRTISPALSCVLAASARAAASA